MNKNEISKIILEVKENVSDLKRMYMDLGTWDSKDFIFNSEMVVNIVHDLFDKISILQNRYTMTDSSYLEIVTLMEEHLEEGLLFKLDIDIDILIEYLKI